MSVAGAAGACDTAAEAQQRQLARHVEGGGQRLFCVALHSFRKTRRGVYNQMLMTETTFGGGKAADDNAEYSDDNGARAGASPAPCSSRCTLQLQLRGVAQQGIEAPSTNSAGGVAYNVSVFMDGDRA